jgi:hypothetical protein
MVGITLREIQINDALQAVTAYNAFVHMYPEIPSLLEAMEDGLQESVSDEQGRLVGLYHLLQGRLEKAEEIARRYGVRNADQVINLLRERI